jgi:hypothetical protein
VHDCMVVEVLLINRRGIMEKIQVMIRKNNDYNLMLHISRIILTIVLNYMIVR